MRVKVFEAENMGEALKKVKETLGPEALILSTRTVGRKGMGLFGKTGVEVTAAVDPSLDRPESEATASVGNLAFSSGKGESGERRIPEDWKQDDSDGLTYDSLWKQLGATGIPETADRFFVPKKEPVSPAVEEPVLEKNGADGEIDTLRSELAELKAMINGVVSRQEQGDSGREAARPEPVRMPGPSAEDGDGVSAVMAHLASRGVTGLACRRIMELALSRFGQGEVPRGNWLEPFLESCVADLLRTGVPPHLQSGGPHRVALVGPTGVGKTTTIAKLAAQYMLRTGKRVALITIDTYRIAAAEQLRVYGDLMNVPVEVVFDREQLGKALARHADKDLVLIDTAGRSPRDTESIDVLKSMLDSGSAIETHLVLASSTREADLEETVHRFSRVPLSGVIFTKVDECLTCGSVLNIPLSRSLPLTCLTNGQRVPEDILEADPATVIRVVMGSENYA
ncbi:MAG TPA: flagellar biosynthesis protein FlhF [Desulfomicrobiaceae bacterium]|nr:flagellar biosynthesis protein FlhF [Desulfomicrobiaceae bacterium]